MSVMESVQLNIQFTRKEDGQLTVASSSLASLSRDQLQALKVSLIRNDNDLISDNSRQEQLKKQVNQFFVKYPDGKQWKDVGIDNIRHIAPIIFQLLDDRDVNNTKRVKNLWDKRPSWWDERVDFIDPNNGKKLPGKKAVKGKKATKQEFLPTFIYLCNEYKMRILYPENQQMEKASSKDHSSSVNIPLKNSKSDPPSSCLEDFTIDDFDLGQHLHGGSPLNLLTDESVQNMVTEIEDRGWIYPGGTSTTPHSFQEMMSPGRPLTTPPCYQENTDGILIDDTGQNMGTQIEDSGWTTSYTPKCFQETIYPDGTSTTPPGRTSISPHCFQENMSAVESLNTPPITPYCFQDREMLSLGRPLASPPGGASASPQCFQETIYPGGISSTPPGGTSIPPQYFQGMVSPGRPLTTPPCYQEKSDGIRWRRDGDVNKLVTVNVVQTMDFN